MDDLPESRPSLLVPEDDRAEGFAVEGSVGGQALTGLPIVKKRVSLKLALGMGTVSEAFWHVLPMHEEPRLTRFTVIELARSHWFDISAARRDLGYEPTVTTEQGVSEYIADFLLKKKKHHFRR